MTDAKIVQNFIEPIHFQNYEKRLITNLQQFSPRFKHSGWLAMDLNKYEALSVYAYTSAEPYHRALNEKLRNGELLERDTDYVELLQRALRKLPSVSGSAYRGILLTADELEDFVSRYKIGATIAWPSFTSSSLFIEAAFGGNVLFEIESKNMRVPVLYSQFPLETEVLFSAGSSFRVRFMQHNTKGTLSVIMVEM